MDQRVTKLNDFVYKSNVLYLMRRDKRVYDNHCVELGYKLSYASKGRFYIGIEFEKLKLNSRQKTFVLEGLEEDEEACRRLNIYFSLIVDLDRFVKQKNIDCIILDFSPLRECLAYRGEVEAYCIEKRISLRVCDANNLVPCKILAVYKKTSKAVRSELFEHFPKFLRDYKVLEKHLYNKSSETYMQKSEFPEVPVVQNVFKGGYSQGMKMLEEFLQKRFPTYHKHRKNPDADNLSNLSPWISNGQISTQKILFIIAQRFKEKKSDNYHAFLREVFAFRETAEHFCLHERNYDSLEGALPWAKDTLTKHKDDDREQIYDLEKLEKGQTHILAWNAAQRELLATGKIHGYCRMYWAKQIMKWTKSPEEAVERAVYLNDTYAIDGNCSNGYMGIMWSICGSMDRGFQERPVIGRIRPMNEFAAPHYVRKWLKGADSEALVRSNQKMITSFRGFIQK
ncbi:deoxyribodipyrimidine photo-lyase-like [Galendromus occidentalis]|uniref:Deoxyribodipyrimidine photo-lyase n=1 Tax=Galendromus occidentalis TaxID=34638 RepID=A0AAJ6QSB4_9ACAR|nr:deoxyribodipyrimidine photo-lyase-like [Galendromus occidentalis]